MLSCTPNSYQTLNNSVQAQDRSAYQDDEEEEQAPTEYDEDGVLTTFLHSFADLRIIKDMASGMPGSGTAAFLSAPYPSQDLLMLLGNV